MDKIVCDASPLIVLAKADLLELLPDQFSEIVVPQAVVEEITAGLLDDPMRGRKSRLISWHLKKVLWSWKKLCWRIDNG